MEKTKTLTSKQTQVLSKIIETLRTRLDYLKSQGMPTGRFWERVVMRPVLDEENHLTYNEDGSVITAPDKDGTMEKVPVLFLGEFDDADAKDVFELIESAIESLKGSGKYVTVQLGTKRPRTFNVISARKGKYSSQYELITVIPKQSSSVDLDSEIDNIDSVPMDKVPQQVVVSKPSLSL